MSGGHFRTFDKGLVKATGYVYRARGVSSETNFI